MSSFSHMLVTGIGISWLVVTLSLLFQMVPGESLDLWSFGHWVLSVFVVECAALLDVDFEPMGCIGLSLVATVIIASPCS